jgi:hypothetical protein
VRDANAILVLREIFRLAINWHYLEENQRKANSTIYKQRQITTGTAAE